MGSPLFFVYGMPRHAFARGPIPGARSLLIIGSAGLLAAAAAGLVAQTAVMAGSFGEAMKTSSLEAVLDMNLGVAALLRMTCGMAACLIVAFSPTPSRETWGALGFLGAVATASFAWSGHGATSEGTGFWIHLSSDILHSLAASAWLGALFVFSLLLRDRGQKHEELIRIQQALEHFSTAGILFVTVILATGLINTWFLVGLEHTSPLISTVYGRLFAVKVLAFVGMLALAASNHFRLTPRLANSLSSKPPLKSAVGKLRQSIAVETALGLLVLALVAWFGTLVPPFPSEGLGVAGAPAGTGRCRSAPFQLGTLSRDMPTSKNAARPPRLR